MTKVTTGDLRALLGSALPDPVLVLTGGRIVVEPGEDRTAGASEVITRGDLRQRLAGGEATDRELELIAATLTTAVVERGA
ncbi:hypothetical protein [Amycolatopsis australiensis]|uniref:Uncharacterized protein n=1 Tax=Amycolatopsis australiensis TaxID=546364 RepID=A0A1K1REJ4_9PSEU|nr:hypothetical protein [Amycolatopsis australiensis]SFW70599.1 hypothetical protein SAMN04489730_3137 [Amycolatopsis australiensis]